MPDQEQERLKRLRERQIADRDPLVKQRTLQRNYSTKARRMRKPFKLTDAWRDLPHVIRTPFYALLLGIALVLILPKLWNSHYAFWVGVLGTVIFILFGIVLGNSLDLRDSIKDQLK